MERIGFIGGGAMAEAMIKGLLDRGWQPGSMMVSDKAGERLEYLQRTYGITTADNNKELPGDCRLLVLAVKPQNLTEAVASFAAAITPEHLLISILAGISTTRIESLLPDNCKVIRAMPNTPALIGAGMTVLSGGKNAGVENIKKAEEIFQAVGKVLILPENMLNAVTGLSGSGPAYIYLVIEALADGGVLAGLPRDVAYRLVAETVKGAASMVQETNMHPAQLKDMVTSPAGTAINGLLQLEKAGVRGNIMEAVLAAARRAEQL